MTPSLSLFLQGWFEKAELRQSVKGRQFVLTYEDFLSLFSARQLATLEKHMADGSIYARQNKDNPYALVLSWKDYAASQVGIASVETMQVCARWKSRIDCSMSKGDRHTDESRARISKAKIGSTHTETTKAKIRSAMLGVNKGRKGTAEEAKRKSEAQKARWARYHADKAAQQGGQV